MYKGKKIIVVGLGISGRSAAAFLLHHGASVVGVDRNISTLKLNSEILALEKKGLICETDHVQDMAPYDFMVVSPGISTTHALIQEAIKANKEIIGEIELGCRIVKNPILAVTGTNGKTTVTLLVAHALNQSGKRARALGNVGVPFTQELLSISPEEIIVLELSSYQLDTMNQEVLDAAVLLNITPDHLDRYGTMESYARSKLHMIDCMKQGNPCFIEENAYLEFGHLIKGKTVCTYGYSPSNTIYTDLTDVYAHGRSVFTLPNELQGQRSHEVENLMAAYSLCRGQNMTPEDFLKAFLSFKKPPHRLQFVCEKNGITFTNDSKGTNIDAVIRAVQTLKGPIILIAGGVDKGSAYTPWIESFANRVKYVCAIGQAAGKIEQQLRGQIPVKIFNQLEEAVRYAASIAMRGDHVLLSPGCSSLDMFRDYAHRGDEFQRVVQLL